MPKMDAIELRSLLTAQRWDSMSAITASKLSEERALALDYYQGDMSKNMPAPDGRSKAVSMDTSDTIEGMMPTLMEIFAGGDEVVRFDPVGPEDVEPAAQETDYVNHVFMQANQGFLILYSFIKDALISKVGIVKIFWEQEELKERETYLDQPDDAFALIVSNPNVEVVEHAEHDGLHDVTIEAARLSEKARVVAVPPEEFGISRHARSIREANYCFHDVFRTESQLIEQGYDKEQVKKLPSYLVAHTVEEIARDTVNESTLRQGEDYLNSPNRLIRVTEHYIRMDYEKNDDPRLYRVTTAGEGGQVLERDGQPDVIEEDRIPFAAMTPIIVTHRFWGRSIADLVHDIQEQKTALIRGMLDNLYLHNNPRVEVSEQHATEATLDDLLVSRPGGIVRTKMPGGVNWQEVPDITGSIYPALQYLDSTREWRTGVSRQGQGVDPNALQNQVATIANQMFNAAQAKVKLIARIFAETGIKDLFMLLHATIRKHSSHPATVRLRNQWSVVDPRDWKAREDMTINVGLGTGNKNEQLTHLNMIIAAQEKAIMGGLPIVSAQNLYNSAKELTKLAGHKDTDKFFIEPGSPADPSNPSSTPLQKPSDPKQVSEQQKIEFEKAKMAADEAHQRTKLQADLTVQQQRFELEKRLKELDMAIAMEKHHADMTHTMSKALLQGGEVGEDGELKNHPMQKILSHVTDTIAKATGPKNIVRDAHGNAVALEPMGTGHIHQLHSQLVQLNKHLSAPKKIIRDESGRPVGLEPVH